jgi:hypothetical protein
MTDQVQNQEPAFTIDDEILTFQFPVKVVNAMLTVLGGASYVSSAALIDEIRNQANHQVEQIIANKQDAAK